MKASSAIIFPLLLYPAVMAVVLSLPGADLAKQSLFLLLPYVFFIIAFAMGLVFRNTRISFLSLLMGVFAWTADRAAFDLVDPYRTSAVLVVGVIYLPVMSVIFIYMPEKGLMKSHGLAGIALSSIGGLMLVLLPELESFGRACVSGESLLLRRVSPGLAIPQSGLLLFAVAVPLLIARRDDDHPALGFEFAASLLCTMTAANFQSTLWSQGHQRAVLVAFMTCAGAVMVWALVENSWRTANIDSLTELPGRRPFEHRLARLDRDFCIAVIDIDYFKKFNDTYGHAAGDEVLRYVSSHLRSFAAGTAYRYGGEEFAVIMEHIGADEAHAALEDLRRSIAARNFMIRAHNRPRKKPKKQQKDEPATARQAGVTINVSIGLARHGTRYRTAPDVFSAADKALYRAKDSGRNRTVTAEEEDA